MKKGFESVYAAVIFIVFIIIALILIILLSTDLLDGVKEAARQVFFVDTATTSGG